MPRVAIVISICCPHFSDKTEFLLTLAKVLSTWGNCVQVVLAGREACSHIIRLQNDGRLCEGAFLAFLSRIRALAPLVEPACIITDKELEFEVDQIWSGLAGHVSEQRAFGPYRLQDICESSVFRRLRMQPGSDAGPAGNEEFRRAKDSYQKDTIRHILYYRRLWAKDVPDAVVYFGGNFHQDRAAFVVCKELSIPCAAIESSFIPDRLYFDPSGIAGNRGAIATFATRDGKASHNTFVPDETRISLAALLCESLGIGGARIKKRAEERNAIRNRLGIGPRDHLALFLGQVPYDTAVIGDGGDFRNSMEAVKHVVLAISGFREWRLLVRFHPKDDTGLVEQLIPILCKETKQIVANHYAAKGLYESLIASDAVITVNSQAGLQAAWLGLPVLVLGHAFYSARGFTIDIMGKRELLRDGLEGLFRRRGIDLSDAVLTYMSYVASHFLMKVQQVEDTASRVVQMIHN